jgi:hypothetical protein
VKPRYPQGTITTEHTVWCGASTLATNTGQPHPFTGYICTGHYQFSDSPPVAHVKREGWKLTREYGWLCPNCAHTHEVRKRTAQREAEALKEED